MKIARSVYVLSGSFFTQSTGGRVKTAALAALAAPARLRILHTHNVESGLAAVSADQTGKRRLHKRVGVLQRIERELVPRFDQVWGVREEDLAESPALTPSATAIPPNRAG